MRNDNSPHKSMLMYKIVCKNIQKLELLPPETDHLIKGWKVNIIKDPKSTILKEKFLSKYWVWANLCLFLKLMTY